MSLPCETGIILGIIMASGADQSSYSNNLLHQAVNGNDLALAADILKTSSVGLAEDRSYDSGINDKDKFGCTPLYTSVLNGNIEMVKLLLQHGARVDDAVGSSGETALGVATRNNSVRIVNMLLQEGADVNRQIGDSGDTVLHRAIYKNYPNLLQCFLEHGGNVDVKNKRGYTPLHIAARNDFEHIVRFLLENGAHIDAVDKYLSTPLHCAAYWGNAKALKELLIKNCQCLRKNNKSMTAMDVAKSNKRNKCTRLIYLYLSQWFYGRSVYLVLKRFGDSMKTDITHLQRYVIEYLVGHNEL